LPRNSLAEETLEFFRIVADKLALKQYEIFNEHRLQLEAQVENFSDDQVLRLTEQKVVGSISRKKDKKVA